jgi:hypothetical protein
MLKRWLFLSVLVLLLALPGAARAQQPVVIDTLEVDLWPEYDRPEMLVIYRISLDPTVSLPADLTFTIPADAALNAVAVQGDDGNLLNAEYDYEVAGDLAEITLSADNASVHIEYYDPNLQIDGDQRHFDYTWPGDYAVNQFVLVAQQPSAAGQLQTIPPLGAGQVSGDGLTYYQAEFGALEAGQTFALSVDYTKQDDALTAGQSQPVATAAQQPVATTTPISWIEYLPWIGLVIGLGIMAFGAYRFWQTNKDEAAGRQRKSTKRGSRKKASGQGGKRVFCHNCGTQSQPGDRFCRNCGERLRN